MCSLHIVMNLPAMAIEFLDTFEGLLSDAEPGCKSEDIEKVPIWVHVYGFSNEDDKVRKNIQCLSDRMTMFGREKNITRPDCRKFATSERMPTDIDVDLGIPKTVKLSVCNVHLCL